jgi:hypothetical protein
VLQRGEEAAGSGGARAGKRILSELQHFAVGDGQDIEPARAYRAIEKPRVSLRVSLNQVQRIKCGGK